LSQRDQDYVLETHREELERLGLQHRAWRPTVLECWRHAGITQGWRVLDVGAGPGYATVDLAGIVARECPQQMAHHFSFLGRPWSAHVPTQRFKARGTWRGRPQVVSIKPPSGDRRCADAIRPLWCSIRLI